jgi:predicted ATP-grasp superfamily ATP-dependent carboligase
VPIPTTFLSTDYDSQESLIETIKISGFPVVVKPGYSKIRTGKGWIGAGVHYAIDERSLRGIFSRDIFKQFPFLVQKRVEGPGVGIFLLMKNGEVIAKFAHRRIREKPPSGGVSVLCESIEPPKEAMLTAVKILSKLSWTGVAMVEFKIDRERNIAKLLEVNARFWGSLQLAISAGVDFPYLLLRLASGEYIVEPTNYTVGLKSRWELGDLDHLFIRLFRRQSTLNLPKICPTRLKIVEEFLFDFFRSEVKNEVFQGHDMKPFFNEVNRYFKQLFN